MTSVQSPVPPQPFALILDEDRELAEMLAQVLHQAKYRALIVPEDVDPLDAIARLRPDLIVTTLHYRGHLGGVRLLETLARSDATRSIPAIVSSTDLDGLARIALQLDRFGAIALGRPFSADDLRAVNEIVRERLRVLETARTVAALAGADNASDTDDGHDHSP